MKNYKLLLILCLLLSIGLFSCENLSSTSTEQAEKEMPTGEEEEMVEGVESPTPKLLEDELTRKTATTRINEYNQVFGGVNAYKYLGAAGDPNGSVMIPRYYTINKQSFIALLKTSGSDKERQLYASLAVTKEKFPGSSSGTTFVSDMIFHLIRPNADGSLNNVERDKFYDYAEPCPINCNPGTGLQGKPVDNADAKTRIDKYNEIYSFKGKTEQYITAKGKNILIPRYYAFKSVDIKELLSVSDSEELYVSLGAEPIKGQPNTYSSDLIFHFERPGPQGGLRGLNGEAQLAVAGDRYFDITKPCPDVCGG